MLNIKETQSTNTIYISGILQEMDIDTKENAKGDTFATGTIKIRVDQDVNGKKEENTITVSMIANKKKKDGSANANYARILGYKDSFTSLAAADRPEQASRVTILGNIEENIWIDQTKNEVRNTFRIRTNFMNKAKEKDEEKSTFELSGVVGKLIPEYDKDGNETGRLIVKFLVIQYGGRLDTIDLIADGPAKAHIEANWNIGDTVKVTGIVNVKSKVVTWMEPQGFGEPIERKRTESVRELLVTGGSAGGLEDAFSYDADEIKAAADERLKRIEELKNKPRSTVNSSAKAAPANFGF